MPTAILAVLELQRIARAMAQEDEELGEGFPIIAEDAEERGYH